MRKYEEHSQVHLKESPGAHTCILLVKAAEVKVLVAHGVAQTAELESDIDVGTAWILPVASIARR